MMKILAPVDNIRFDIEDALEKQTFSNIPLPFIGMDKSGAAVCELFAKNQCEKDILCPFRHVRGDKSVVCKHWLRGLCKKGDECEFLHEYDMSKMPECYFYSKFAQCGNKECEFLHINSEAKIKDCPWYDRGFCRHGPNCKNRHLKKVICQNYLFGFCLDGPECKFVHPKFELPVTDPTTMHKKQLFVCDYCGEKGHKIASCFKLNPEHRQAFQAKRQGGDFSSSMSDLNKNNSLNTSGGGDYSGGIAAKVDLGGVSDSEKKLNPMSGNQKENSQAGPGAGMKPSFGSSVGFGGGAGGTNTHFGAGSNSSGGGFQPRFSHHGNYHGNSHHNHNHHHNHSHNHHNNHGHHGGNFNPRFNNPNNQNSNNNNYQHHHNHHNHQGGGIGGASGASAGSVSGSGYQPTPASEVTCFKCGEKGHYANKCNKSVLSFLRTSTASFDPNNSINISISQHNNNNNNNSNTNDSSNK